MCRNLIAVLLVMGILGASPALAQDLAQNMARCQGSNLQIRVTACTALINSRQVIGTELAITFNNRGDAYFRMRDIARARADFDQAIRTDPRYAVAYASRGQIYEIERDYIRAVEDYNQAINLDGNYVGAINSKAWLLATAGDDRVRNGAEAVALAQRAAELAPNDANIHDTLAAAYAENGQFENAMEAQQRAIQLARNLSPADQADIASRLSLYRAAQPYREAPRAR